MKTLTKEILKQTNPCVSEYNRFKRVFPKGMPLTMDAVKRAQKRGVSLYYGRYIVNCYANEAADPKIRDVWRKMDRAQNRFHNTKKSMSMSWEDRELVMCKIVIKALRSLKIQKSDKVYRVVGLE